jgi:hypothetical protein
MKKAACIIAFFACATIGVAKEHTDYQTGKILQMDSAACGSQQDDGKSLAGELIGTDSSHKKTKELLCQQYTIETDHVVYRIRPKDDKHPVLLPIGETANFRMHKDHLLVQVPEADGKEREYIVVSMTPRQEAPPAQVASKN